MLKWGYEYFRLCEGGGATSGPDGSGEGALSSDKNEAFAGVFTTEDCDERGKKGKQDAICGGAVLHTAFL